jgi:hypothetical protein
MITDYFPTDIDCEPEQEFAKPRRALTIIPYYFGTRLIVESADRGQDFMARRYTIAPDSPSARRLEQVANGAWPDTNGLILSVNLTGGPVIVITRPGWTEDE